MLLCLDVGNSHIHAGIFKKNTCVKQFRMTTDSNNFTSDQIGIFLRQAIRENDYNPNDIIAVAIASVVPSMNYSLCSGIIKYFNIEPFMLKVGVKTGLKIKYPHPKEVGSDMIAAAISAINQFPNKNLIVIDMGTATVINPITANGEFLGAVIMAGVKASLSILSANTSQLPNVNIVPIDNIIGKTTAHCIQAGLYYGTIGALKEIINKITIDLDWSIEDTVIVATGGFSKVFSNANLFNFIIPELVLEGLRITYEKNMSQ
jgi:type III pantothenate kinase